MGAWSSPMRPTVPFMYSRGFDIDAGRRICFFAIVCLPLILRIAIAASEPGVSPGRWGAVADTLSGAESGVRVTLKHAYLVPGSESVTVNGVPLDRSEYQINFHLGTIRIDTPLSGDAVVVITYQRQPFFLKPMYSLRKVEVSSPQRPVLPPERLPTPAVSDAGASRPGHNLVFGGTKSVSFTVGNSRGTALDQTLQATIEGNLTPTIKVKALLSDNNLPIQPEGNTEELEYLDQVFVEIEGTNAKATLGDFGFANRVSTFSPFTRQLKGISTEAWSKAGRVTLAGASAKGVFKTVTFRGTTGLQGPYELLSASRNTGEVIIAGTERVTIDGIEAKRGQNQDYKIDYDLATITFTPRRLITNDTEIAVDFEATQEKYDRGVVVSAVETQTLPGGVELQVLFARERDDKDRPRNIALTDEERDVLGKAGDNADAAITGGIAVASDGNGDYLFIPADADGPDRYAFDDSTGTFIVSFVEVGVGSGDYSLGGISKTGRVYYEWAGTGAGNYTIGKALPMPESLSLITTRARRNTDRFEFDVEWNMSDYDRNLFSSIDDDDNVGDAGRMRLALKDIPAGRARLGVAGALSTLEDRFTSFDKSRPSYFYRDWNLENVALAGREVLGEVEASVVAGAASAQYSFGRLDRDDQDGTKHEGRVNIGNLSDRGGNVRAFDTRTDRPGELRTRRHATARGAFGVWRVVPSVVYGAEEYLEHRGAAPGDRRSGNARH